MKTLKILLAVIIGIIAINACKKDDATPEETPNLLVGVKLDSLGDIKTTQSCLFVVSGERVDTPWVYKPDGTHQIDPGTGKWQFNPPTKTPTTLAQEIDWIKNQGRQDCLNETNIMLDNLKDISNDKIIVGFPKNPKIISKVDETGKSYIIVTEECFNTLYERLKKDSNKPIQQLIKEGMDKAIIPTQNVLVAELIDKVSKLLPGKKSPAQFRMMSEAEKIEYLDKQIQEYQK